MSNARDKANIPVLNFQSKGIDDNADATAITIDSSESLGLGTTSPFNSRPGSFTISNEVPTIYMEDTNSSGSGVGQILYSNGDLAYSTGTRNGTGTSNSTEHFRIKNDGNVGIGTSSPSSDASSDNILEIAGSTSPGLVINDTGQASKYSLHAVSADFVMNYGSTAFFRYKPGDSQITAHDNLKIITGTSSGVTPASFAEKLFIDGIGNQGLTIGTATSGIGTIAFGDSGDNDIGKIQYQHGDNSMLFVANAAERMRITSSGSVGIGTTSPANNLHIFTDASGEGILVKSTGNTYNDIIGDANRSGAGNNLVRFRGNWNGNSVAMIALSAGDDTTNKDDGRIEFFTSASGSSQNNRMVIEPNGNVGIGTSSPSARVNILESTVGTDPTADSSNFIKLTNNDIGTTNEVFGIGFSSLSGSTDYLGAFVQALGNYSLNFNHSLIFGTRGTSGDATERMRIDSSGNVGIGNTVMSSFSNLPATNLVVGSGSGNQGITIYSGNTSASNIGFADGASGDARNQGIIQYHHNGDYMRFFTSAAERMRIDSSGAVRIGNTSSTGHGSIYNLIVGNESSGGDAGVLIVTPNNENAYFGFGDSGGVPCSLNYNHNSNFLRTYVNGSEAMRIDSSGNVGIGTSSPGTKFDVNGTIGVGSGNSYRFGDNGNTRIEGSNAVNVRLGFFTGGSERMRIDSSGNVGIGTTSPDVKFHVVDTGSSQAAKIHSDTNNAGVLGMSVLAGLDTPSSSGDCKWVRLADGNDSGKAYIQFKSSSPNAEFAAISDERLKTNIQDTDVVGLDVINNLRLVKFDWNETATQDAGWSMHGHQKLGFVAQEVEAIAPEFISEDTNGFKIMGDSGFVPYLIKAMQEQQTKIEELEARITTLEANNP